MATLSDDELQKLFSWVDTIPLSRPKRNINRDFSDGVLTAEIIAYYFPKLVDLHNYTAASNVTNKTANWTTLNNKVLKKLKHHLPPPVIEDIVQAKPGAIEVFLHTLQYKLAKYKAEKSSKGMGMTGSSTTMGGGTTSSGSATASGTITERDELQFGQHLTPDEQDEEGYPYGGSPGLPYTHQQQQHPHLPRGSLSPQPHPPVADSSAASGASRPSPPRRHQYVYSNSTTGNSSGADQTQQSHQQVNFASNPPARPFSPKATPIMDYIRQQQQLQQQQEADKAAVALSGKGGSSTGRSSQQQQSPSKAAAGPRDALQREVDEEILLEKEETIQELRETVEILELKMTKLEQLLRLKDTKIQHLSEEVMRLTVGMKGEHFAAAGVAPASRSPARSPPPTGNLAFSTHQYQHGQEQDETGGQHQRHDVGGRKEDDVYYSPAPSSPPNRNHLHEHSSHHHDHKHGGHHHNHCGR